MGQTQPLDAKFLNWVFNKKWFFAIEDMNGPNPTSSCKIPQLGLQQKMVFCNQRHKWAKPNLLMQNSSIGSSTKNGFLQSKT
jgi:hypothetical protein